MTSPTLTLTEFLLARIAEDGVDARAQIDREPELGLAEDFSGPSDTGWYLAVGCGRVLG